MNLPQGFELFAILAVLVLLFGSKKLPDAARSLGRSMRIFKSETKGLRNDDQPALAETDAAREQREFEEWKATRTDRSETR
ncbi:MAG TPA: Sec-independent protein translocase subunit TatA [Frankiaceae bacterium]|nr:Sec-independent protein translocase subunit TatA [Frankiaceae bacterium]